MCVPTVKEIKANLAVGINNLEKFLKTLKSKSVKLSAEMAGLSACLEVWKEHCKNQGMVTNKFTFDIQLLLPLASRVSDLGVLGWNKNIQIQACFRNMKDVSKN